MAGLIPQSFIDDLLQRTDIVELIDKTVSLKKAGKNYTACCPFHKEKTPSFSVQPDKQFYYCFGCGAGGNSIGFIMAHEQLDFPEAVEALAQQHGLEVPKEESRSATRQQSENARILEILDSTSKFYQQQLRHHSTRKSAVEYLKKRGVSGEIARDFGLGYAPPGWDNALNAVGISEQLQTLMLKAGLIIEKSDQATANASAGPDSVPSGSDGPTTRHSKVARSYYDRFRHRIMFPIRDSRGRTLAFGGRVLGEDKPKYLNSPETPVFHKAAELYGLFESRKANHKSQRMLVVEGYMDVIALAQMGIRYAVATLGTATNSRHLARLFRQVTEVIFCFDGDEAGRTAAWRALQASLPAMEDGRQIRFLFLDEGDDPDSLVRKIGKDQFVAMLDQAMALEDFFFQKLSEGLNIASIEGKARLSKLAQPLLAQFPSGIYAKLMTDRLAKLLGVSNESLTDLLTQGKQAQQLPSTDQAPAYEAYPETAQQPQFNKPKQWQAKQQPKAGLDARPRGLKAIELLLHKPAIASAAPKDLQALQQNGDESEQLLASLIEMVRNEPNIETYTLVGYCYDTNLGNQLTQLLQNEQITPDEGVEAEFLHFLDNILSEIDKRQHSLAQKSQLQSILEQSRKGN